MTFFYSFNFSAEITYLFMNVIHLFHYNPLTYESWLFQNQIDSFSIWVTFILLQSWRLFVNSGLHFLASHVSQIFMKCHILCSKNTEKADKNSLCPLMGTTLLSSIKNEVWVNLLSWFWLNIYCWNRDLNCCSGRLPLTLWFLMCAWCARGLFSTFLVTELSAFPLNLC